VRAPRGDRLARLAWGFAVASVAVPIVLPSAVALVIAGRAARALAAEEEPTEGERVVARAQRLARVGAGIGLVLLLGVVLYTSRSGLQKLRGVFFNWTFLRDSFPTVMRGFWLNVRLFVAAEVLVLVWALIVAVVRSLPGRGAAPLRWLAIAYIDLFRGLPALVTIYLVGFGLPLVGLPLTSRLTLFQLGVLALTLVYGAYVAEVYRAGIESVHWSQTAAARSLAMTHTQTLRHVVLPQAVRRVVPPLLNDFIGLQKDTALVSVIGLLEGFNRARIYAGNKFNLSSVVGLGICFVVITIPMSRFTDYLIRRDQQRREAS
jgi:polar amino acid transport system permease protein